MKRTTLFRKILCQLPWKAYLLPLTMRLLSSLSAMLLLGASAWIIASAALHPPLYTLALGITLVRACGIGRAVFRYLDRWLSHRAVFQQLSRLRGYVYSQAADRLPERHPGKDSGAFLHDLTQNIDQLRDFYLKVLLPPANSLLLTLLAWLILWPISHGAALLCLLAWLTTLLLAIYFADWTAPAETTGQNYRQKLLDILLGLPDLQGNDSASTGQQKLDAAARQLTQDRYTGQQRAALADTAALCCCGIAWTGIFFLLAPLLSRGILSGIELAVYLLALQSLFAEYPQLPEALRQLPKSLSAASQLLASSSRCNMQPTAPPTPTAIGCLLQASHIRFSYEGALPIFQDLEFIAFPGEKIVVMGESGSGKTTLFHLLTRLWECDAGCFFLHEKPYSSQSPEEIRAAFSSASQAGYIFSDSLRANFRRLYPELPEAKIWQALQQAQLADTIRSLPQGLDMPLGEDGRQLSGGQRQRLLLALAFAGSGQILLLDEPTAGLDSACAAKIFQTILQEFPTRTIFIITHDLPCQTRPDRILQLLEGQLLECSPETVLPSNA